MKIPTSHATQQTPLLPKMNQAQAGSSARLGGPSASSQAQPPANGPVGEEGWSPSERLDRYADHMLSRLDAFESAYAESGLDLSALRDSFTQHIEGLQDAMRTQGLSGAALAQGIQDAVHMVRDGVRDAMGMQTMTASSGGEALAAAGQPVGGEQTNLDIDHSISRLDALQDHIVDRMDQYMANLGPESAGQVEAARSRLDHSFERLRDALSTGQMSLEDVRRSIANVMDGLRDDLAPPTVASATAGSGDSGPVTTAASQSADLGLADQAAPTAPTGSTEAPAWSQFLAGLDRQQESSLTQLWQSQPRVQALLMGLQQDARGAQGLDLATYSPSAQLQALRPEGFGGHLDIAI